MNAEEVIEALGIEGEVLNIYPYGSYIYGTNTPESDKDFIIVMKSGLLDSGAFRDNAISNKDESIQGVIYSRGGFQDAINNYEISALECLFIPEDKIIRKTWPYKLTKIVNKDLAKKIIAKASASWHIAKHQYTDDEIDRAKKGIWHALRILTFGIQLKDSGKIKNFAIANTFKTIIDNDNDFSPKKYISYRDILMEELRK